MRQDKMKSAKVKAGNFCAYQERTQQEVRDRLYKTGLYSDEVEEVLAELITENYVNEERFACTFARGKFNLKQWGKIKIAYALQQKNISSYCIDKALSEISGQEYENAISSIIDKKSRQISGSEYIVKNKIARHLISKGFESELVWSVLDTHLQPGL